MVGEAQLERAIAGVSWSPGAVLRVGAPPADRALPRPAPAGDRPLLEAADVAAAIASRAARAWPSVRSGGHCFAGRSSTDGVVVDVGPMSTVTVAGRRRDVGAGARLGTSTTRWSPRASRSRPGAAPPSASPASCSAAASASSAARHGLTSDQLLAARGGARRRPRRRVRRAASTPTCSGGCAAPAAASSAS